MFSPNLRVLPSCNTYEGAVRVWERAKSDARNKRDWPDGTRPLDDTRKTHYAVIKDGAKVVFRLHKTNCVEWYNPDHFYVDSSYDSGMTRNFIERYVPAIRFENYKGQQCVRLEDQLFRIGRHTFRRFDGHNWQVASHVEKPARKVLDHKKAAEVRAMTRDFSEWVRAMWAVCGNDGNHPWVGQKQPGKTVVGVSHIVEILRSKDVAGYERMAKARTRCDTRWNKTDGTTFTLTKTPAKDIITKANEELYKYFNCYIDIDYDAPIPRD